VIEHRFFLRMGELELCNTASLSEFNAVNGSPVIRDSQAVGEGHRSNMLGYATAQAVSQDAFDSLIFLCQRSAAVEKLSQRLGV